MSSSASTQRMNKGQAVVRDPAIVAFQHSGLISSYAQQQQLVPTAAAHQPPIASHSEQRALRGRGIMNRGGGRVSTQQPQQQQAALVTSPTQGMIAPPMYMDIPATVTMRNNSSSSSSNNNARTSVHRERGVIEKMLHSYGFIQCAERQCRLFFHFSELTPDDVYSFTVGDPVEFQQGLDRRTNKPVATCIVRVASVDMNSEVISEKPVVGQVLLAAKLPATNNQDVDGTVCGGPQDGLGRVTYEQSGETFFLTYSVDDIEIVDPNTSRLNQIKTGDQVEFYISTDERNGNLWARRVRKLGGGGPGVLVDNGIEEGNLMIEGCPSTAQQGELYMGVVCSLKDNYGFIERADVVKELFFHFSEFQGNVEDLQMGDDVSFNIQIRNNKEVGVNIHLLPPGTVIFEDVAPDKKRGKIQRLLKSPGRSPAEPLHGRIVYETLKGPIEIAYGERDQMSEYTLQVGDIVEFYIATDRRDQLKRATNICLIDVTFTISGEKREQGFITALKESFGFIRCVEREGRMFFNFAELLNQTREPKVQDEVEFTVLPDPGNATKLVATRIKYLPRGTVNEEDLVSAVKYRGVVAKAAAAVASPAKKGSGNRVSAANSLAADPDPGIILYEIDGTKQTIPYSVQSLLGDESPRQSDHVEFNVSESLRNGIKTAVSVRLISQSSAPVSSSGSVVNGSTPVIAGSSSTSVTRTTSSSSSSSSTAASAATRSSNSTQGSSEVVMRSKNGGSDKDAAVGRSKRGTSGTSSLSSSRSGANETKPARKSVSGVPSATNVEQKSSRHSTSGVPAGGSKPRRSNAPKSEVDELYSEGQPVVSASTTGSVFSGSQSDTSVGASHSVSGSTQSTAVTSIESSHSVDSDISTTATAGRELGFVATLKDSFGFIEMANRDKEVFFHYSNYEGEVTELDVGDEVEFYFGEKTTGRVSAARVKKRSRGTIIPEEILPGIYEGEVVRGLRITNPDQAEYCGLIQLSDTLSGSGVEGGERPLYTYGVMSLIDRRDLPQRGDQVRFQLSVMRAESSSSSSCVGNVLSTTAPGGTGYRATRVLPVRKLVHAKVDSIKGQTGWLTYEVDSDGKRLQFSLSDVTAGGGSSDGSAELSVGDDVEFAVIRRPHTGKLVATAVRKIGDRPRPERLARLKSVASAGADEGPRLVTVRQPRGPDGSRGFRPSVTSSTSSPQMSGGTAATAVEQQQPQGATEAVSQ